MNNLGHVIIDRLSFTAQLTTHAPCPEATGCLLAALLSWASLNMFFHSSTGPSLVLIQLLEQQLIHSAQEADQTEK